MKKLAIIAGLALASISSFAQGNFLFTSGTRVVWDNWSTAAIRADSSNSVAFLFGSGTPAVDAIYTGTATNGSSTLTANQLSTAWTDILTDPNFRLGTNNATGSLASVQTSLVGAINYNASTSFGVTGTSASGGTTTVFVIGWSSAYATPADAAAAGSPVGWSAPFSYAYQNTVNAAGSFSAGGLTPFGVVGAPVSTPEPATLALAGLGGASLLLFRRKK